MCSPGLFIGGAMAVAQTVSANGAQKAAAKGKERQQLRAIKAEHARVSSQYSSMRAQEAGEQRKAADELQAAHIASLEAYGEAAAIDNGVGGKSIQDIQGSYLQSLGETRSSIFANLAEAKVQRGFQYDSIAKGSAQNVVGINQPIAQPDKLGNAISGLSSGLSIANSVDSMEVFGATPADAKVS